MGPATGVSKDTSQKASVVMHRFIHGIELEKEITWGGGGVQNTSICYQKALCIRAQASVVGAPYCPACTGQEHSVRQQLRRGKAGTLRAAPGREEPP